MKSCIMLRSNVTRILLPSDIVISQNQFARKDPNHLFKPVLKCVLFSSVNEVICHGIPDKRKLREGDIINLGN